MRSWLNYNANIPEVLPGIDLRHWSTLPGLCSFLPISLWFGEGEEFDNIFLSNYIAHVSSSCPKRSSDRLKGKPWTRIPTKTFYSGNLTNFHSGLLSLLWPQNVFLLQNMPVIKSCLGDRLPKLFIVFFFVLQICQLSDLEKVSKLKEKRLGKKKYFMI